MKQHKGRQRSPAPGTRPPGYVLILAASDWSKEHDPASRSSLRDALHTGKDPHPGPEPDLEAEP